jgi:hypothetical protein
MRGSFARAFDRQATNMPIPPLTFPEVLRGGAVAEVDELLDAEPRGQRRGEDHAGVRDRVGVVEGHGQKATVRMMGLCDDGIEIVPSGFGSLAPQQRHSPSSEGLSHNWDELPKPIQQWISNTDEGRGVWRTPLVRVQ